jgi:hypothetical protein
VAIEPAITTKQGNEYNVSALISMVPLQEASVLSIKCNGPGLTRR